MKEEISAAAEFISRIFLTNDSVSKEKVNEFNQHLSQVLEERFRDHWHETCPTKGQAYRCIRVCPEEPLDPILEKVCNDVGISCADFNLPIELTLWVDPKEVICKIGDLKCSYHTVAKKDQTSGNLNNQTDNLDIEDLIESARELYIKKQTVVIHPIHSTEMHIPNPYPDGSPNGITMAVRMNGTNACNLSSSPPTNYDGSPRGKGKSGSHALHHKSRGFHYYGKSSGGKGTYMSTGAVNANHHLSSGSHIGGFSRSGHHHHHHHSGGGGGGHHHGHHQQQQHHHQGSNHHSNGNPGSYHQNGYMNGYQEENGYVYGERSGSPTKMNGNGGMGPGTQLSGSPTPEQIQQQMQHPPPLPPHMQPNAFDPSSMPPPQQAPQPSSSSGMTGTTPSPSSNINNNNSSAGMGGKMNGNSSNNSGGTNGGKFQGNRGGGRNRQSPVKDMK